MPKSIKTYANQRVITVKKSKCDKIHPYTMLNLAALDEAAAKLKTKAGFKLYIYLVKNQDSHEFALSSKDFITWAGVGIDAYTSAFNELVKYHYLIKKKDKETIFIFYDKPQLFENNIVTFKPQIKNEPKTEVEFNALWSNTSR